MYLPFVHPRTSRKWVLPPFPGGLLGKFAVVPGTHLHAQVQSASCVVLFVKATRTTEINPHKWSYILFCEDSHLLGNGGHSARTCEPLKMLPCSAETSRFDYSLTQSHAPEERNPQLHRYKNLWRSYCFYKVWSGEFHCTKESTSLKGLRAYFGSKGESKNGEDCIVRIFMIYSDTFSHAQCCVDTSRRLEEDGQVAEGVIGNAYRILFGKNGDREITWWRWEHSVKLDGVRKYALDCIAVVQDKPNDSLLLYCGRVPAANSPGCTAIEGLLYKP